MRVRVKVKVKVKVQRGEEQNWESVKTGVQQIEKLGNREIVRPKPFYKR